MCIRRYSKSFYNVVDNYYRLLDNLGARYVFECRGGICYSYIEFVDGAASIALLEAPGLVLEEARSTRECADSVLLPLPTSPTAFLDTGIGGASDDGTECFVLGLIGSKKMCLGIDSAWRHVLVIGSTGSGKTHTAARIAHCLSSMGIGVVVLDWHGEYVSLLRGMGAGVLNVLTYPGLPRLPLISSDMPLDVSVDILEHVLSLSPFQSSILATIFALIAGVLSPDELSTSKRSLGASVFRAIGNVLSSKKISEGSRLRELYLLLVEVFEQADELGWSSRAEREIWAALLRRIQLFVTSGYEDLFSVIAPFPELFTEPGGLVVVDLASIHSARARRLYAYFMLYGMYFSRIRRHPSRGLLVVVEEAHNLLDLDIVPIMLQEARKYRLGLVVVTHTPSILPPSAQSNLNTLIVHRIVSERDKEFLQHVLSVKELGETISRLRPGEAIVVTEKGEPVIASIDTSAPCK